MTKLNPKRTMDIHGLTVITIHSLTTTPVQASFKYSVIGQIVSSLVYAAPGLIVIMELHFLRDSEQVYYSGRQQ